MAALPSQGGGIIGGVDLVCCGLYAVLGAEDRGFHYVAPPGGSSESR
jgi:hypothetical protein